MCFVERFFWLFMASMDRAVRSGAVQSSVIAEWPTATGDSPCRRPGLRQPAGSLKGEEDARVPEILSLIPTSGGSKPIAGRVVVRFAESKGENPGRHQYQILISN